MIKYIKVSIDDFITLINDDPKMEDKFTEGRLLLVYIDWQKR